MMKLLRVLFCFLERLFRWQTVCLLLFVASLWFVIAPFFEKSYLEKLRESALAIPDQECRNAYSRVTDARKAAAVRATFDAYEELYGKIGWGKHFASDCREGRGPRYLDIAEVVVGLSTQEDRQAFINDHLDVYAQCLESGALGMGMAQEYARVMKSLQALGGKGWHVVCRNSFAPFVFMALRERPELWSWFVDNEMWSSVFLSSIVPENGAEDVIEIVEIMRKCPAVFRSLHSEIESLSETDLKEFDRDGGAEENKLCCYAAAFRAVAEYRDILKPLAAVNAPMLASFNVILNNLSAFDLSTEKGRIAAGNELANIWCRHESSPVWEQAALPTGCGVVEFYRRSPHWAATVLGLYGDCYVAKFLLDWYGESDDLLSAAAESLVKCEDPGWAILELCKDNQKFKRLLARKDIGTRVVPYYLVKGRVQAQEDLESDPKFAERYFNPDGSLRREKTLLVEAMPFVGGVATVVKNWSKGYPCTMGEIGWAAFDVVDIALTCATLGASSAAGETAKISGKQAVKSLPKMAVKQASKQLVPRKALTTTAKAVVSTTSRRMSVTILKGIWRGMQTCVRWTVVTTTKTIRFAVVPVKKVAGAWRAMPPQARRRILKTASWIMFGTAVWNRAQERLPVVIHDIVEECVALLERIFKAAAQGALDGVKNAISKALDKKDILRNDMYGRMLSWAIGIACMFMMFSVWRRYGRKTSAVARI